MTDGSPSEGGARRQKVALQTRNGEKSALLKKGSKKKKQSRGGGGRRKTASKKKNKGCSKSKKKKEKNKDETHEGKRHVPGQKDRKKTRSKRPATILTRRGTRVLRGEEKLTHYRGKIPTEGRRVSPFLEQKHRGANPICKGRNPPTGGPGKSGGSRSKVVKKARRGEANSPKKERPDLPPARKSLLPKNGHIENKEKRRKRKKEKTAHSDTKKFRKTVLKFCHDASARGK